MARFKRRKPRVVWLPMQGNDIAQGQELGDNGANGIASSLVVSGNGAIVFDALSLTFDYSDAPTTEQGSFERSLQDLTSGNAYRLRRIVGKIHVGARTTSNAGTIGNVDVACGFMVNRTDDSGNPLSYGLFGSDQQRSPLAQDAQQDPWIWRRRWILSPVSRISVYQSPSFIADVEDINDTLGGPTWPQTNAEYGSVADGPHIDQKTARVIANQERLYFWISARRLTNVAEAGTQDLQVDYVLDARLLASLRTNSGNRRNASR